MFTFTETTGFVAALFGVIPVTLMALLIPVELFGIVVAVEFVNVRGMRTEVFAVVVPVRLTDAPDPVQMVAFAGVTVTTGLAKEMVTVLETTFPVQGLVPVRVSVTDPAATSAALSVYVVVAAFAFAKVPVPPDQCAFSVPASPVKLTTVPAEPQTVWFGPAAIRSGIAVKLPAFTNTPESQLSSTTLQIANFMW